MQRYINYLISFSCILISGCVSFSEIGQKSNRAVDTVMSDGMTISMKYPECFSLSVRAKEGLLREYTWNGGTRSAVLLPRLDKWNGHYGAYSPGDSPDNDWEMHDGINRLLAEESILNFKSRDHLLCALAAYEDNCREKYFGKKLTSTQDVINYDFKNTFPNDLRSRSCFAYTDDGYYMSIGKGPGPSDGGTLFVTVYKFLIDSQPVRDLPGSTNERIIVTHTNE